MAKWNYTCKNGKALRNAIDGEVISGGYVYANNDNNAYDKIEEMIEADYDNFAADGYHNFEIVGFEEE